MTTNPLLPLRDKINQLDHKLIEIIAERRQVSTEVIQAKINANIPLRDLARERALIKALIEQGKQYHLDDLLIRRLYQIIIEDSVLLQQKFLQEKLNQGAIASAKIAFLGPKGSYSHSAARRYASAHFDQLTESSCNTFKDVFEKVESQVVDYGMLPIENSLSLIHI